MHAQDAGKSQDKRHWLDDTNVLANGSASQNGSTPQIYDWAKDPSQVVFIESNVPDLQDLLHGLAPSVEAFVLGPSSDGLQQIADIFAANDLTYLSSISIVSHGASGELQLGSSIVTNANLASYAPALTEIGASLAAGGNIQLYGCDVAEGAAGQQFIDNFSSLTGGAPVEASTQLVGDAADGGSFTLNASSESPAAAVASNAIAPVPNSAASNTTVTAPFTATALASYSGTLPITDNTGVFAVISDGTSSDGVVYGTNTGGGSGLVSGSEQTDQYSSFQSTYGTPYEIQIDAQAGLFFILVPSNGGGVGQGGYGNTILEGKLSQLGSSSPTLTPIFTDDNTSAGAYADKVTAFQVDVADNVIFVNDEINAYNFSTTSFPDDLDAVTFSGANFSGSTSDVTVGSMAFAIDGGNGAFFEEMVVDPTNKAAYFVETSTSTSNVTANGASTGTISDNELFKATWTSTPTFGSSNGGTFNLSQLPIAQGGNSSTLGANNLPTSLGELGSLSIDPTNQILYFATDAFNGGTSGLFDYDLTGNSSGNYTEFYTRNLSQVPGVIQGFVVDPLTGKYYFSAATGTQNDNAIYEGTLGSSTKPTQFITVNGSDSSDSFELAPSGLAIDNAPMLTTSGDTITVDQNSPAQVIDSNVAVSNNNGDPDLSILTSPAAATVGITANFESGDKLTIGGNTSGTLDSGAISYSFSGSALTLTGTDTVADYQTALDDVQFSTTSSIANAPRTIAFTANDGVLSASATDTVDVEVLPVIGGTGNTVKFYQNVGVATLDSGITVADGNGANITSATVTISSGFQIGDGLNFTTQNGISEQSFAGGVLTLSGNATVGDYAAALASVTYSTSNGDPTGGGTDKTRSITWSVTDADGFTSAAGSTTTLDVYVTPALAAGNGFTAPVVTTSAAVFADSDLRVTDVNTTGSAPVATVTISGGSDTGDTLSFNNETPKTFGDDTITPSYNSGTHVLTLTGTAGTSPSEFQTALEGVDFDTTATNSNDGTRTLTWEFNDDAGNNTNGSNSLTTNIDVEFPPTIGGTGNTAQFYQIPNNNSGIILDSGITVTDPNVDITSATVTISSGYAVGDDLGFNVFLPTQNFGGGVTITAQFNVNAQQTVGTLTLTTTAGNATASDFEQALAGVQYGFVPAGGDPTDAGADKTRTIAWSVTDADAVTSATGSTTTLDVFAQPIVTVGAAGTPTETSTSGPVIADSTVSITDYNGTTIHDASVQIKSGDVASDTLTINGTTSGSINDGVSGTISYSFTGTTLTLTGTDTVADYTTALDEVKFDAVSPNSGTRTLSWQVNDEAGGNTNDSVPVTTNVDVAFGPELTGGQNFGETEGTSTGPLQLVTFTDSEITSPTTGDFTAAIDWGDGTGPDTTGTIADLGGGIFAVDSAGHTYVEAQAAPYQIAVTVTDTDSVAGTATDNAQVADAPLTAGTLTVGGGVEGVTPATLSATFTDANTAAPTSDFSGTINWGDGNTTNFTSGDVAANGGGAFTVSGSHLYVEDGSDNVTVTINDVGGSQTIETGSTTVADAPLTEGTVTVGGGVEGTAPATLSAAFTDANAFATNADFSGTINWGDGNTTNFTSGDVAANGGGAFTVNGSHLYAEEGPDNVTVTINDEGGSQTIETASTTVADAPLTAGILTVGGGVEGTTPATLSAAFTDANVFATSTDFSGTIDWGDGNTTTFDSTAITQPGGIDTSFILNGTHTYVEDGPDNVTVTINDVGSSSTTETTSTTVADAPLTAGTVTVGGGVEGTTPATLSATFSDANTAAPTGDFSGTINWGDGNTTNFTSGDVAANGSGAFTVSGTHTYAEEGPDNVTVTINDVGGSQTIETGSTTVADAPLTAGTVTAGGGVEGVTPTTLSATFSDANTGAPNTDFSGTINWGDGNTTSFMSSAVTADGGGNFTVGGSHQYLEEGSYTTTVTINDDGGSLNGNSSTTDTGMTTVADAPLTAGTVTLSAGGVEGVTPTTLSATFSDANAGAPNTDFSGTIDWGDGDTTTFMSSAVTAGGGGTFTVGGSHQYLEEGTYTTTVTVNDDGGSLNGNSSTTDTGVTTVADAPLTPSGVTVNGTQDVALTGPVATFTDANPNGSVSDFTATVTWGDGTPTSFGTITESGGVFTVTGTHTYAIQGAYMPTVTIVDDGGSAAIVTDTFSIAHTPPTVTAGGTATYIGAGAVTLDAGVTVSDPDSGGDLAGATVTISTGFIAGDTLEIGGQTSGTITDSGGTINYALVGSTLSLSGPDTLADYQAALDAVTYSFTPRNGDATKGGTDTSRTISWTVNDGAPSNGTSTAASTLLVPATPVVTAVAASVNASASESFTPAQLFSASDAAGEPILTYEVKDETTGANQGFWVLNGAVLPNGQMTTLTAAQLSALSFVAGSASTPVSDTLEVAASDAAGLGAFTSFTVTAAAHAPTTPPTVTAASELQAPNQALAGSSLFSGTAFGGNTITSYEVEDITTDSGHWMFNGVVEPTNQVIDVTVAQLAQLSFDTGYGSDTLKVRANDGTQWGSFTNFTVTPPPNAAPPAGSTDTLMMLRNSDGAYEFYDIGHNAILLDGPLGAINPVLQVAGVGGFNGADTADLLMRNPTTGVFTLYDVSNNNITGNVVVGQVGLEWTVSGFGDFSTRANETDMLMRNSNTGAFEVYDIANNAITFAGPMGQVGLEWSIAGFGDFSTRANETDMLMRNSNTGAFEVYDIANNAITFAGPMGQVGLEWSIAGFGDFSTRANETDMLMRNGNTGAFEVYDISNNTITSFAPMGQVGLEWTIAGFGDFSGNANETDMLMRNSNTGVFELLDINNNTIAPMTTQFGQVGLEWSISGVSATPASAPPTAQLSGIAADPAGAALGQLTQAMASFAPTDAATAASSPLSQAPAISDPLNLLAATSHPQPIS